MAKYTIIADIGKGLINLLRDKLVPDAVDKAESIGICDPKERGDYIVGIHPYDIKEDTSGRGQDPAPMPDGTVNDPPAMLELYYVISVNSKAEIESKALDEAKIIGKIIQVFKDNPTIPAMYMPSNVGTPIETVPISMLPLNMEEKVKVWTMFGESYKLSVFYVVGPIAIDSEKMHKPKKRVETIHLDSHQYEHKKVLEFATFIKEEDIDDDYTRRPDEDEDEDEDSYDDEDSYGDGEDMSEDEDMGEEESTEEESYGEEESSDEGAGEEGYEEEEPLNEEPSGEDEELSEEETSEEEPGEESYNEEEPSDEEVTGEESYDEEESSDESSDEETTEGEDLDENYEEETEESEE
ncbi:MAG: DUF4255 domain-containing protein [Clostridia bacterium]|nr:DUF4255 domain-containing protein [Clostridia bacterium]